MTGSKEKDVQRGLARTIRGWLIWPRILVLASIGILLLFSAYISFGIAILLFGLSSESIHEFQLLAIALLAVILIQWFVWRKGSLGREILPLWNSDVGERRKALHKLGVGGIVGLLVFIGWTFLGNFIGNTKVLSLAEEMRSKGFAMTTDDLGANIPVLNDERRNLSEFLKENKKSTEALSPIVRELIREGAKNEKNTKKIDGLLADNNSTLLAFTQLLRSVREQYLFDVDMAKDVGPNFYWGSSMSIGTLGRLLILEARHKATKKDFEGAFDKLDLATKVATIMANEPIFHSKLFAQGLQRDVAREYLHLAAYPEAIGRLKKESESLRLLAQRELFLEGRQNYGVSSFELFLMHVDPDLWYEWIRKLNYATEELDLEKAEVPNQGLLWKLSAWLSGGSLIEHLIAADSFQLNFEMCTTSNEGTVWERNERYIEAARKSVMSLLIGDPEKVALTLVFLQEQINDWYLDLIPVVVAAHLYRRDQNKFPESPNDVLTYLQDSSLLIDPMSKNGEPVFFERIEGGLKIYSVGRNGRDDGGVLSNRLDVGFVLH